MKFGFGAIVTLEMGDIYTFLGAAHAVCPLKVTVKGTVAIRRSRSIMP